MKRVLLVDDDPIARDVLQGALEAQGFIIVCAGNGFEAINIIAERAIDLIVLDVDMPTMNGYQFLAHRNNNLPVILVSATDTEDRRIKGFELGADDFISKPISVRELTVRIAALKRRVDIAKTDLVDAERLMIKDVEFSELECLVKFDQRSVILTQTEFNLFKYLFERKGQVVPKAELQMSVLKKELGQFDRNLDMHISNTRKKLAQTALPKTWINTVRGQGYCFSF
ncbi:response regulator transcription factor [Shewanella mesophila]|uniref:response regulator transcription factor n=1 Tax=Shewanella mesophila TaxID=2864208 RepID=UPI001C65B4EC|nr:response regulator transcription factor [Shewanella mesophila]QYJ84547.1 response regulator transcription factor [Shewanella mesophila]